MWVKLLQHDSTLGGHLQVELRDLFLHHFFAVLFSFALGIPYALQVKLRRMEHNLLVISNWRWPLRVETCCSNFNLHNYSCVDGNFYVIYNKLNDFHTTGWILLILVCISVTDIICYIIRFRELIKYINTHNLYWEKNIWILDTDNKTSIIKFTLIVTYKIFLEA